MPVPPGRRAGPDATPGAPSRGGSMAGGLVVAPQLGKLGNGLVPVQAFVEQPPGRRPHLGWVAMGAPARATAQPHRIPGCGPAPARCSASARAATPTSSGPTAPTGSDRPCRHTRACLRRPHETHHLDAGLPARRNFPQQVRLHSAVRTLNGIARRPARDAPAHRLGCWGCRTVACCGAPRSLVRSVPGDGDRGRGWFYGRGLRVLNRAFFAALRARPLGWWAAMALRMSPSWG
jgi:hypothetical protein